MFELRRGHTLRKGRCSIQGQAYLLTTVTKSRQEWFLDFWLGCVACRAIAQPRLWQESSLMAWVLMPDHLHLLFQLAQGDSLSRVAQRVKSVSALEVGRIAGSSGIWQPGFHDRAIRADASIRDVGRYVVFNPVRAGLVRTVGDYPFWDAVWLEAGANPLEA